MSTSKDLSAAPNKDTTSPQQPVQQQPQTDTDASEAKTRKRRKDLFGDCALIEIIHLHECLRGALKALEQDVKNLNAQVFHPSTASHEASGINDLERRIAGRFKVIWSVFRAHSAAEDEFIWPALQEKTKGVVKGSPQYKPEHHGDNADGSNVQEEAVLKHSRAGAVTPPHPEEVVEQEAYEEDHADEERMFSMMDSLLVKLRLGLTHKIGDSVDGVTKQPPTSSTNFAGPNEDSSVNDTTKKLSDLTKKLSQHLMVHLEKEEDQCLPLVVKHLSKTEIHDLVGNIMGKRSSDMIAQIMTMAVQNLNDADREEMVKYMKQAMAGTFFDRWLSMAGWMEEAKVSDDDDSEAASRKRPAVASIPASPTSATSSAKRIKTNEATIDEAIVCVSIPNMSGPERTATSQAELEKLIRAIATNPNLTPLQKNTTIQGLRDSVYKNNQKVAAKGNPTLDPYSPSSTITVRRDSPPSVYMKKVNGKMEVVWSAAAASHVPNDGSVPLFSEAELAPTYHEGAASGVLGCPHYPRACKLRHPLSGRLYTCRLCCEQEREMPSNDKDEPLDRFAVQEVMCMKCNTLQPAAESCSNSNCESQGEPFAKYFCRICNLYDDRPHPIFHCPYCNCCRMGKGLGIDFRHCMQCNACVSLEDNDHRCLPQKLQGSCSICHETLFQSTKPLRGLKCGHVMHLSCFNDYRRGQNYTCPLCMRCMDDMSDYFALLDAAVRMQPMPAAFFNTRSNVYCQDCEKTGQCKYHFVGQKCPHCGSYNTREMGRVQVTGT